MDCPKPRFSVSVDCDLYDKINTYQHDHRMKSQNQAITEILKIGIQAIQEEEGQNSTHSEPLELPVEPEIPKQLARIIDIYHSMNSEGKEQLADYAEYLGMTVKYKKDNSIPNQATG